MRGGNHFVIIKHVAVIRLFVQRLYFVFFFCIASTLGPRISRAQLTYGDNASLIGTRTACPPATLPTLYADNYYG